MRLAIVIAVSAVCCRPYEHAPRHRPVEARAPETMPIREHSGSENTPSWLSTALNWPQASETPLLSAHLGTPHLAEIHVNPEALSAYRTLVADTRFSSGTWFVERLRDARTGRSGPFFALERTRAEWRYWVLDAHGRVDSSVSTDFCAACHAAALSPPVFGLPRKFLETAPEAELEVQNEKPRESASNSRRWR